MTKKEENALAIIKKETGLQVKNAAWNSLAEESKKSYSSDYRLFLEFVGKDLHEITASDLLAFVEHLEAENYKNSSINRKMASLSKMFKVMVLAGEIKINPVDQLKQLKKINRNVSKSVNISLTIQDIRKVVKVNQKSTKNDHKISLIVRTLAMTGLRVSEFANIKNRDMSDFDKDNQIISIVGKGKKERKIYLSNDFIKEIREIFPITDGIEYLFYNEIGNRYDRRILYKRVRKIFMDKIGKDVHPHTLRHSYITQKISVEKQDIKAVSRYCGHQSISTTLDMYVDTALDVKNSKLKI